MLSQLEKFLNYETSRGWLGFLLITLVIIATFLLLKQLFYRLLKRLSLRTSVKWDDLLLQRTQKPASYLAIVLALLFCFQFSPLPGPLEVDILRVFKASALVLAIWLIERSLSTFVEAMSERKQLGVGTQSLLRNIGRAFIIVVGGIGILDVFGIPVTPLLASLGIGSLAVALALQDTLGNFFSGIYILADQPIRVGDFIRLEDGTEGYVDKVGWRSTHIRMLSNNMVVIPNSKVSASKLVNFDLASSETAVLMDVGVSYDSDLQKVEKVTCEVAKEVMGRVPGGVKGFDPFIRYNTFGDNAIQFTVIMRACQFTDQFLMKHEFVKALHERYLKEGISIPFPQRVLHLQKSDSEKLPSA